MALVHPNPCVNGVASRCAGGGPSAFKTKFLRLTETSRLANRDDNPVDGEGTFATAEHPVLTAQRPWSAVHTLLSPGTPGSHVAARSLSFRHPPSDPRPIKCIAKDEPTHT